MPENLTCMCTKYCYMKNILICIFLVQAIAASAQTNKPVAPTLKSILLSQLKSTHNQKEWFVPVNIALDGLTPEQAMWKDSSGNHSIGQLTSHLIFWNQQQLSKFKGEKPAAFDGNNEETFASFNKNSWKATVEKLDKLLTDWETAISQASETTLQSWYATIAHISTHNAYHIGELGILRQVMEAWPNQD